MPRLRLVEADRKRLGCPEFLPISISSITNREAVVLQQLGYPTPMALGRALDSDTVDYDAWTALVWVALRHAGIEVDPKTLEFSASAQLLGDEEPAEPKVSQGKAPAPEASTNSPRKRSTRTATSRRRSTSTGSPS